MRAKNTRSRLGAVARTEPYDLIGRGHGEAAWDSLGLRNAHLESRTATSARRRASVAVGSACAPRARVCRAIWRRRRCHASLPYYIIRLCGRGALLPYVAVTPGALKRARAHARRTGAERRIR